MGDSDPERLGREAMTRLQLDRLRETVERAGEVPFYAEAFETAGVSVGELESVSDLTAFPFTTKADFRTEYPDGLFAAEWDDVARIHASSGTSGKPKIVSYTDADLDVWGEVVARSLVAAGVSETDVVQNAYGYGLFTGGLGLHAGLEKLGAAVVPTGGGDTARQIETMRDLDTDVLCCTPSYCLYLAEAATDRGHDPRDLPIERVVIGAEPFTDPMRTEIEERLDVTAVDIYGLSEVIGPGVSIECADAQDGLHVWEDHFLPEVIDPETGERLPPGEEGELVLTTLTKEALPVVRYRTGDVTSLRYEECSCGRTCVRMDNVTGRTDDLLIVRGVNVYPSRIEEAVVADDAVAPHYRIDLRRENGLDRIELTVEPRVDFTGDPATLRDRLHDRVDEALNVSVDELAVVEPGGIDRTETGKVQRVYDHR